MEAIFGILLVMGGAIFALLKKLDKLNSDKKLNDIKVADAKLEEKQVQVQEQKTQLQEELKKVEAHEAADLSDSQIEDYWKGRNK